MNKTQLTEKISQIPDFELKPVAVKEGSDWIEDSKWKAVCVKNEQDIIATMSNKYKLVQFRDCFLPVVNKMPDSIFGEIYTYKGKAWLYLFPETTQSDKIGVALKNSVDKSTAVEARFSVLTNGYTVSIPKKIGVFRTTHTGKALEITQQFMSGLGDIRKIWENLVKKYNEFAIDDAIIDSILKELKMTSKMRERIKNHKLSNLYELFMATLKEISLKGYKSEIHKNKKVEKLAEIFYNFSIQTML